MSFNDYNPCDDSVLSAGAFQACFGAGSVDWGNLKTFSFISNKRTVDPFLATGSPTTAEEYYALFQDKANWDTVMGAVDIDKVVVTPTSGLTTVTGGEAKEVTLEDDTVVSRGHNSQVFTTKYYSLSAEQEKQLASIHGKSLGFLMLTEDNSVIIKEVTDAQVTGGSTNPFFDLKGSFSADARLNTTGSDLDYSMAKFGVDPDETFGRFVVIKLNFSVSELG